MRSPGGSNKLKDDVIDIASLLGIKCAIRLQKNEDGKFCKREVTIVEVVWEVAMGGNDEATFDHLASRNDPPESYSSNMPQSMLQGLLRIPPSLDGYTGNGRGVAECQKSL